MYRKAGDIVPLPSTLPLISTLLLGLVLVFKSPVGYGKMGWYSKAATTFFIIISTSTTTHAIRKISIIIIIIIIIAHVVARGGSGWGVVVVPTISSGSRSGCNPFSYYNTPPTCIASCRDGGVGRVIVVRGGRFAFRGTTDGDSNPIRRRGGRQLVMLIFLML